jgi:hypothetical protein
MNAYEILAAAALLRFPARPAIVGSKFNQRSI